MIVKLRNLELNWKTSQSVIKKNSKKLFAQTTQRTWGYGLKLVVCQADDRASYSYREKTTDKSSVVFARQND